MAEDLIQVKFSTKKRKLYRELRDEYVRNVEMPANSASRIPHCCMHGEANVVVERSLRSPDLDENVDDLQFDGFETENSTFSREGTPTTEVCGQLSMDSSPSSSSTSSKKKANHGNIDPVAANMPTAVELEEFFVAAENQEQKRFAEKYNYDIVKDVPLEGKYQWVRMYTPMNFQS